MHKSQVDLVQKCCNATHKGEFMSEMMPDLEFLQRLAATAATESLRYFRVNTAIENKYQVGFDPVTEGDKRAEAAIRSILEKEFPEHGILGEEYGPTNIDRSHVWVIDPIDGTRAFIAGLPVWGTLVGLKVDGHARMGFIHQPYTGELYVADGSGSLLIDRQGNQQKLETRKPCALSDAIMFTTSPKLYAGRELPAFERLERRVKLSRYGTDCYGAAMVASGYADIWIEPDIQSYDIVGIIPVIEQAGGIVTKIDGGRAEDGGTIIACGSPELHAEAIAVFNG